MLDKSLPCLFPNVVWCNRSYKHVFSEMGGRSNERRFVGTVGEHLWTGDSVGIESEVLSWQEVCPTFVFMYRWLSGGVASLPEGKSQGLCLVQLCVKYRLVSATSNPYH